MVTQVWSNFIEQPLNISNNVGSASVNCDICDGSFLISDGGLEKSTYVYSIHCIDCIQKDRCQILIIFYRAIGITESLKHTF